MEKVVNKICLDSDVIISLLKKDNQTKEDIEKIDGEFYMTVISLFEVEYGKKSEESTKEIIQSFHIQEMDSESAILAANILKELRKKGEEKEFRDIFIAAICITHNFDLFTYNKRDFERMKKFGLKLIT